MKTITAAPASTPTRPAAANAATLSTHAMGPHHAGHAAAPAAGAPHAVDAATVRRGLEGGAGGRRHTPMLWLVR